MSSTEQLAASFEVVNEVLPSQGAARSLRAIAAPGREPGLRERWVHAFAQGAAHLVVQKPRSETLRFGLVREPEEFAAVGRMRLRVYGAKLPYLLKELSPEGMDAYDAHSFIFATWWKDRVVATVRTTRYPYETLRYVPEPALSSWMKEGWDTDFLEWGRLLVDSTEGFNRLTPALLTYAGLYLHGLTPYRKYFGYARPHGRKSFSGFQLSQNAPSFTIPERGEHAYQLLKGELSREVLFSVPRWLGSLAGRMLSSARAS
ncbi:MAG TPA: hypothetical protein VFZ09_41250 [Archangium sp.]|uniref:hypothetical protein n=1 Tax=Archangium sp. TaxID=1872627 RepID=UPI002E373788|nr:hypothetical protein [Archangium sp.]HEX5752704.1 hypothetical protein [Archangium sp.]